MRCCVYVRNGFFVATFLAAMMVSHVALGGIIAYEIPSPVVGNQAFGNGLGHDFDVNATPILVTHLGVFDELANGITAGTTLGTQIWARNNNGTPVDPFDDSGGAMLASMTFTNADPGVLIGSQRFKPLPVPLLLSQGSYTVNSDGYNATDQNGNDGGVGSFPSIQNDGGGMITFVGAARFGAGVMQFPGSVDSGPTNRYGGPTFQFDPIPEPSSLLLALAGLLALAALGARQFRQTR